jgi:hypothetical protein
MTPNHRSFPPPLTPKLADVPKNVWPKTISTRTNADPKSTLYTIVAIGFIAASGLTQKQSAAPRLVCSV